MSRRRKVVMGLLIALLVLAAGTVLAGHLLSRPRRVVVGPPPADLRAETVSIRSESGSTLRGWLVLPDVAAAGRAEAAERGREAALARAPVQPADEARAAVLLLHGVHSCRKAMLARARVLARAGYAALLVDLQAHGESSGERITFGWLEARDAEAGIAFLRERFPGRPLGAIGVSMGGAALVLARRPLGLSALVLESVYPTVEQAAAGRMRRYLGRPGGWIGSLAVLPLRWRFGLARDELRPIDHVASVGCPLLLVQGSADSGTSLDEARALLAAAREPKDLLVIEGAEHVDLHAFAPAPYERRVLPFLATHLR